ncbi:MAG: general secretion pathway protein GspK [Pseudomonadota bacterium]|jgi:type II secretory pathway component PulK
MKHCTNSKESGAALIMVILMIAITSALLMSLTDSTYVSMRLNRATEQRIKAEYILKSAVNLAQVLIKIDQTQFDDPAQDAWMQFANGQDVPGELVGVTEPNVKASLLITSERSKIPILSVVTPTGVDQQWRDVLLTLFQNLGFDNDQRPNEDLNPTGNNRFYSSAEMVANLIDYLDYDKDSYSASGFAGQGMEADLTPQQEFRNNGMIESLANELGAIPGFTASRIERLLPLVTNRTRDTVNVNAAPAEVLDAVIKGMDRNAAGNEGSQLVACREQNPFNQNFTTQMGACIDPSIVNSVRTKLVAKGDEFSVIAKVEYGLSIFFASAQLRASNGRLPTVQHLVLY